MKILAIWIANDPHLPSTHYHYVHTSPVILARNWKHLPIHQPQNTQLQFPVKITWDVIALTKCKEVKRVLHEQRLWILSWFPGPYFILFISLFFIQKLTNVRYIKLCTPGVQPEIFQGSGGFVELGHFDKLR